MANWHPSVIGYLERSDYQSMIQIYEEIIENEPNELNNYWYLGLTYLLAQQHDAAEYVWSMPFFDLEADNYDNLVNSFITVIEPETNRQAQNQNWQLCWILGNKIKEIAPQNLTNILHLIFISIQLNSFKLEYVEQWELITLLQRNNLEKDDYGLLFEVLNLLLEIPQQIMVDLTKVIAKTLENKHDYQEKFRDLIWLKTKKLGYQQRFYLYGAKLLEILLDTEPQNLELLRRIFIYYLSAHQYDNAKDVALIYHQYSQSLIEKAYADYQLLCNAIEASNWLDALHYESDYQSSLTHLVNASPAIEEKYLRTWLNNIVQPLLYLKDQPQENRELINGIARIWQQEAHKHYSCPVNYLQPQTSKKKLKIGYIGHTLRSHSVGLLSRWLITHHNREEFSLHTYFVTQREDQITQKFFKDKVDQAQHLGTVVNDVITLIEKDEIDILVDLDSFTHNLTAMVMALKPAPIQISWLGMDSNGIPNIDYFIADPYVLPENAQDYYQEKIWRLPDTYLGIDGFEIDVPNLSREDLEIPDDAIVYLNVQGALKRNPQTIHLQMKILDAVPNSYLLIKGKGNQEAAKKLFTKIAETEGVATSRLRFLDLAPTEAVHRANLKIADVVLDTYPYNGATTTLETLWMEIPLVTKVGQQFAARNSYTFMKNAGISEGIAWNDDEYVEWGIKLGTSVELRQKVSWKLRQSKITSPLWNGKKFTQQMENAYRQMWQIYLNQNS